MPWTQVMNRIRITGLVTPLVFAVLVNTSVCRAQTDDEIREEIEGLWLSDVSKLEKTEIPAVIERVEALARDVQGEQLHRSCLFLLGQLYLLSDDEQAALDTYEAVLATQPGDMERHLALEGQRRVYERFGRWEEAVSTSRRLIDDMAALIDDGRHPGWDRSSLWSGEVSWLASYYERKGDYLAAADTHREITDRQEDPRLRWSRLHLQARLLKRAGMDEEARALYVEARDALAHVQDLPLDSMFLSTEFELLRGVHGGVVSREYLAESAALVEKYRACGTCTLIHEYNIAMETLLGGLDDLNDDDKADAVNRLTSVIERAEDAQHAGDEVLARGTLRSAYLTAIGIMTFELRSYDEHVLYLLDRLRESLAGEPAVADFMSSTVAMLDSRFSEATWASHAALDKLREQDASTESDVSAEPFQVADADVDDHQSTDRSNASARPDAEQAALPPSPRDSASARTSNVLPEKAEVAKPEHTPTVTSAVESEVDTTQPAAVQQPGDYRSKRVVVEHAASSAGAGLYIWLGGAACAAVLLIIWLRGRSSMAG